MQATTESRVNNWPGKVRDNSRINSTEYWPMCVQIAAQAVVSP